MTDEAKVAPRSAAQNSQRDRVLIVEDEENARRGYEALLQKWGCDVLGVSNAEDALARFAEFQPATLIADVELPGMDGLELLRRLGPELRNVPAIIITGKGSEERAVAAIESGAFWYIEKPLKGPVLHALLDRALGKARDARQLADLTRQLREVGRLGELVGASKPMQEVMRMVELAAPSSASVLITGETGSGKEILARTIHKLSPRNGHPFVAINCSAIPETLMESEIFGHERGAFTGAAERRIGCFELADGGTLLLDEIGEMPAPTQAKLLRVLEDRKVRRLGSKMETPVDVRVLAATNKDPEQAVAKGTLRQDLYFRLNVFHIHLPPLREHKEDLQLLVDYMLRDINTKHNKHVRGVGAEVMDVFLSYTWPGNVRELRNILERAAIVCDRDLIGRPHLPTDFGRAPASSNSELSNIRFPIGTTVDAVERALIVQTLSATGNNKTRAAELLGISLKTLHNKLKEYGGERADTE
ncbi:MAG TPA: sigma-54 dependent transcriptional regulator [Candidatus Dormibacteraeota bacterium]|nr:sigma-54 dependent transcriptional regulator [Candidatus Dormibacteraeota bacterium]